MKILHITASYKPAYIYGGPVMSVAKLCEEVLKTEVRSKKSAGSSPMSQASVTVYTTLANGKEELPYQNGVVKTVDGVSVHYFKRITKDHSHLSPALLWQLWKTTKKFDIIHIHAWWNLVTMPACLIAVFRGCKVVLTPRGTLSNYSFENHNNKIKALFHQWIGKPLLNKTYFHCTSLKEVIDTQKLLKQKAIFNIPNFVELPFEYRVESNKYQEARSERQEAGSEKQVESQTWKTESTKQHDGLLKLVFLSRIEEKKGLELLLDCLAKLDLKWSLSIVGDGELNYVKSLKFKVESLKLENNVKWFGSVYGEEKFNIMANHDFLVLPSFDENFANVVIESLFVGTPVLVTKNVGLSDYVKENNLGYVCERTAASIINMLIDSKKAKDSKLFNRDILNEIILRDFEVEALSRKYLNMYQSVIDN
jgi:glycosyltransferase involved in cell wall biosynthesis